jgi:phage terminase small subunit
MPRVSAAALGVVLAAELPFPPPAHLNEAEQAVFRDVVASSDHGHFRPEDRELLALYCVQVVIARTPMKRRRRAPVEEMRDLRDTTRLIMSLSTKLRLGPKSRAPDNRRAATAGLRPFGPRPWDREPEEQPEAAEKPIGQRWGD